MSIKLSKPIAGSNAKKSSTMKRIRTSFVAVSAFILSLGSVPPALAASYYWDTTTTGLWTAGSNWSTSSTGSPAGTVAPSSSITADSAVFNGSSVNGNETIQLSAATSIAGITFNNTGTTTIASTTVAEQKITIGAGGITMAATAGNVTFDITNKAAVTIGANQTWTNNNSAATLGGFSGIVLNANTLTLAGAGNFSLNPSMTATSAGVLNANQTGTLTLGGASASFVGTLNTGLNGGTVLLANSIVLTGVGALVNIQGGTIATSSTSGRILVANTSVSNDFTLGQAATGTGVVTISGAMDLNNATRQITTANSADTLSGVISNGGLTKAGIGTLTLSGTGANTYTGLTTVGAGGLTLSKTSVNAIAGNVVVNGTGTLTLGAADQIINTSNVEVAAGTLALATFTDTVNGVKLTGGTITGSAGGILTSTTAYDFQSSGSVTGSLAGTAGANKTTAGTVTFTGGNANTYTGLTTVSAGTLSLNKTASVDALAADVLVNGTGTLTLNSANQIKDTANVEVATGGTFGIGGNNETVNGLKLTGGAITGTGGNLTSTTAIDFQSGSSGANLAGTAGSTKTTAGTISLSGASIYSGGTTLTAGTIQMGIASVGSVGAITSSAIGTGTLTLNGGTLSSSATTARTVLNAVTIGGNVILGDATNTGALTFSAGVDLGSSARTLTTANAVTFGGIVSNGDLTKAGASTLTLNGTSANTYSGLTTVSAGGLTLSKTSVNAIAGNVLVNGTGTLTLGAADQIIDASNVEVAAGTFALASFNETVNGVKLTGGTITGTTGVLTSSTAYDFQSSGNVTGSLAGTVGANKTTAGTVTFTGGSANTYTGLTTVSAGNLVLNRTDNVDSLAGNVLVNGTGTLSITKIDQIKNTANVEVAGGTLAISGNAETVNGVKLTGGAITGSGSASVLTSTTAFDFQSGSSTAVLAGTAGLTKTTGGTVSLGRASTYSGGTTLTDGTLQIASASTGSVGLITSSAIGTGTLNLNGGTLSSGSVTARTLLNTAIVGGNVILGDAANNGKLTFSADVDLGGSVRTLTTASAVSFDGVVSNGGINKAGASNLTLGGANTYTGTTTINEGTLIVAGAITSSSVVNGGLLTVNGTAGGVTVNNGGSLGGSGTVGAVTLTLGSHLKPGNSPGLLTASASSSWAAGSYYNWEINDATGTAGTNWDVFYVSGASGALDLSALSSSAQMNLVLESLSIANYSTTTSYEWVIAKAAIFTGIDAGIQNLTSLFSIDSAAFNGGTVGNLPNGGFQVVASGIDSNNLRTLSLMAIPEPSTGSLLAFGLSGLVLTRLLRRKQS